MIKNYLKFCDYTAKACGAFAVGALIFSILVIVELVFERYFFQRAITWQTELVTMLLVASTFIGSAYVLSEKFMIFYLKKILLNSRFLLHF
jgi:TRAP-type C4-dicarboxylate transport system permease small subunit